MILRTPWRMWRHRGAAALVWWAPLFATATPAPPPALEVPAPAPAPAAPPPPVLEVPALEVPAPAPAAPPRAWGMPDVYEAAEGLYVEFGRGITLRSPDGAFALTVRGRVQTRATVRTSLDPDEDLDALVQIRRARLVLIGDQPAQKLQFYLQFGVGPSDLDDEDQVPLRDAQVVWSPLRDLSLRVGQMKVPFNRERLVSSSALQFADRSRLNAEFNLDRDVGVQVFSNDLFGLDGLLSYQLGVYNGAGQNRTDTGLGLLSIARLSVQPLGAFPDALVEADLKRSARPRLSLGVSAGVQNQARRTRSTHGADLEGPPRRTFHGAADLIFKWHGWSAQLETLYRAADPAVVRLPATEAGAPGALEKFPSGFGYLAGVGHLFEGGVELAGRYVRIRPETPGTEAAESSLVPLHVVTGCVGYYFEAHNLKLQTDYEVTLPEYAPGGAPGGPAPPAQHEARVQLQVFF